MGTAEIEMKTPPPFLKGAGGISQSCIRSPIPSNAHFSEGRTLFPGSSPPPCAHGSLTQDTHVFLLARPQQECIFDQVLRTYHLIEGIQPPVIKVSSPL